MIYKICESKKNYIIMDIIIIVKPLEFNTEERLEYSSKSGPTKLDTSNYTLYNII